MTHTRKKELDPGKWAEGEVEDWLDARANRELGFAYHRFPDARAARGALASQPADFLVARRWRPVGNEGPHYQRSYFLEVKETANPRRLPRGKISQYGRLKVFNYAGVKPLVLIYASAHQAWCLLTAPDLFAQEDCPTSFPFLDKKMYATHAEVLQEIFK